MNEQAVARYAALFPDLQRIAKALCEFLESQLAGIPRIDSVAARAKEVGRFAAKAARMLPTGEPKYAAPLVQIQDQVGARVVVYYKQDVDVVTSVLERYLRHVERQDHVPDSYWQFGYFGRHWIFAVPDDVIPNDVAREGIPRFFELQVKTLFQHAWAETNHDLCYKATTDLTPDQQRRFAFTAAQAWGADQVLEELKNEIEGKK